MDFMNMMGKVKEVQSKMKEVSDNLVNVTHTSEAGAGMVKATVNGKRQVVNIEYDDDLIKPDDKEMLRDLTIAAINKALEEMDGIIKEEMKKATDGMLPNIPGLDLENFFKNA